MNESDIVKDYISGYGLTYICKTYNIGKIKAKAILESNNIAIRPKSSFSKKRKFVVNDWKIDKYPIKETIIYKAISKDGKYQTYDYMNNGGHLTSYIKGLGIEIPSLYDRRLYYMETGNYWWEQWFDIIEEDKPMVKKCPYCDWETEDIDNKSGAFEQHLKKIHDKNVDEYLKEYPNDAEYFPKYKKIAEKRIKLSNNSNFIICPICHNKFEKMTLSHILTHNLSFEEFKNKYPDFDMLSDNMRRQTNEANKLGNLSVSKNRFILKYEREIREFLDKNNVAYDSNRQILIGKEIDILINDKKIGIEFNGLKWHTEWLGKKNHSYHLDKTIECNKKGYGLIHIFEDEYVNHKDIVYSKISHIIGLDINLPKIMGRKCEIREIYMHDAKEFLEKYHIQGFSSSTLYLGAFYKDKLVAVMTFKNGNLKNPCWELTRFATDYHYRFQGVGSKMFTYFVRKESPSRVISFADRRWTTNPDKNLYTNLGFTLEKYGAPDYRYYLDDSKNGKKYQRIHKMSLNKKALSKKYGFPLTMTETEMAKELGYDRIWDCGLIKYAWSN